MIVHTTRCTRRQRRSGGVMAVEFLLLMPLVLLTLLGLLDVASLLQARQQLLVASRDAARVASRGAQPEEIQAVVQQDLGEQRMALAAVRVEYLEPNPETGLNGQSVAVTVSMPAALGLSSMSSVLSPFVRDQWISGRSVMRVE